MKIFYSASAKLRNTIQGEPEQEMVVKPGKEGLAEKYLSQAGHCLVTTGMNTQSGILTALYSEKPALGVAFCPIVTETKAQAKAFAVWLNSVFGWLPLMKMRSGGTMTFPNWSHTQLRQVLLPNPNQCNLDVLIEAFEQVKHEVLLTVAHNKEDAARKVIDRAAAKAAGIPWAKADELRKLLAAEPTIARQKKS